ncbi:hypothetical protein KR059_005042, partial [Drosophila kikkawai]
AICCLLVTQILSQDAENRRFCDRLTQDCVSQQGTVGTADDTVNIFNDHCRRNDRTWQRITRCQLVRASCILTMVRCDNVTCKNVARALGT